MKSLIESVLTIWCRRLTIQKLDQAEADEPHVRDKQKHGEQNADEPDVAARNFPDRCLSERAPHHQHSCDGRLLLTESKVDGNDQPKVHRVDTDCLSLALAQGSHVRT